MSRASFLCGAFSVSSATYVNEQRADSDEMYRCSEMLRSQHNADASQAPLRPPPRAAPGQQTHQRYTEQEEIAQAALQRVTQRGAA